jgi:dTDP-4-dehydrorhamnose reductase
MYPSRARCEKLSAVRVVILGTSGQLASELRLQQPADQLELCPAERVDLEQHGSATALLERLQPNLVINAAAYTAVDRAEQERDQAFAINAEGPREVARWCAGHGSALVHVSTDYVFDGQKQSAYVEADSPNPASVYGQSKLAGEIAVREALARHLVLRTSWVFSRHGHNFVKTMLRLANERDELRVVADQRGKPTSAADLARHIWALAARLEKAKELAWGTYHLANQNETTWYGLAEAVLDERARITGTRPKLTPITTADYPTPAVRPANSTLDTSLFETTFGLQPASWRHELCTVVQQLVSTTP